MDNVIQTSPSFWVIIFGYFASYWGLVPFLPDIIKQLKTSFLVVADFHGG